MIIFTSKNNGIDFQSSTVQTANKEKENERKIPFSLFDFQTHRTLQTCAIEDSHIAHS